MCCLNSRKLLLWIECRKNDDTIFGWVEMILVKSGKNQWNWNVEIVIKTHSTWVLCDKKKIWKTLDRIRLDSAEKPVSQSVHFFFTSSRQISEHPVLQYVKYYTCLQVLFEFMKRLLMTREGYNVCLIGTLVVGCQCHTVKDLCAAKLY